jgi:hypothetical protein
MDDENEELIGLGVVESINAHPINSFRTFRP